MAHFPVHDADRDKLCGICGRHASFFGNRGDLCSICESKKQHLQCAVKSFWRRFLFSDHQPVRVWTGHLHETRDADTDDEEPDGMLSTELDFVNPLMKLSVSRGKNSPMEIIIDMLPMPPFGKSYACTLMRKTRKISYT